MGFVQVQRKKVRVEPIIYYPKIYIYYDEDCTETQNKDLQLDKL